MRYVGRFAPSPSGPLHAGSLVAALGSWLDARAHGGRWLVRLEDIDTPRCVPGTAETILQQLTACGLASDEAVVWQSQTIPHYEGALQKLRDAGWTYPCGCSRKEIANMRQVRGIDQPRHGELVYPGTCRTGLHERPRERSAHAWRLWSTPQPGTIGKETVIHWHDRRLGGQQQNVTREVGDFVLKRADGLFAYQLAVVVDDAHQGVTDVVRGADLADNTPRQIHLQRALGLPTPRYLHLPLVLAADGQKLSKQNGATALDVRDPVAALRAAAAVLGLQVEATGLTAWLAEAVQQWRHRWMA